jgi:hypothetical protein
MGVAATSASLKPSCTKNDSCSSRSTAIAPAACSENILIAGSSAARAAQMLNARAYSRR